MKSIYKILITNEIVYKMSGWRNNKATFRTESGEIVPLSRTMVNRIMLRK